MMEEPLLTSESLGRALRKFAFHALRAGLELLAGVEAVLDELGRESGNGPDEEPIERIRVD